MNAGPTTIRTFRHGAGVVQWMIGVTTGLLVVYAIAVALLGPANDAEPMGRTTVSSPEQAVNLYVAGPGREGYTVEQSSSFEQSIEQYIAAPARPGYTSETVPVHQEQPGCVLWGNCLIP